MKIAIEQKFRPFSHLPKVRCLLPGTELVVEATPSSIRLGDKEFPFASDRESFTVQQDLERNSVWVFSRTSRIELRQENSVLPSPLCERLSLGSHKKQDWELMMRRWDLKELFPLLFLLGQKTSPSLLPIPSFEDLRDALDPILMPRSTSLFSLYRSIRDLFLREEGNHIHLLPASFFAAGRMTHLQTSFATLDLEWTKGKMRRAILKPKTAEPFFLLAPGAQKVRLRSQTHESGKIHWLSEPFSLTEGAIYFLDRWFFDPLP